MPTFASGLLFETQRGITPDFSLYRDWPVMLQQWNVYHSRWVGRFWQEHGLRIIPTVNWSTPDSYE